MDSSTGLKVIVILLLVVVIAVTTGMFVISQTTNSSSQPAGRTVAIPLPSEKSDSSTDAIDKELKRRLTYEQYMVTRKKQTEAPWSGKYWNYKGSGIYKCICCGSSLFDSSTNMTLGPVGQASTNR